MDFDLPQALVDAEAAQIAHQLWHEEHPEERGHNHETIEPTEDHLRLARRRVKLGLLLADIGTRAGVKVTDAELATLRMPILGLFGSKDRVVPLPTVTAFEAALQRLGKKADIRVYEGADHAFANPSGTAYDAPAAEDAWRRTTAFLKDNLDQ